MTKIVEQTTIVERIITATPRPTPKATATPAATATPKPSEQGTRQNPYKVGQTANLVQGGKINFEFTITEVIRGEAAYTKAIQANSFNDAPAPGYEFVLVYAKVKYSGEDQGVLELTTFDMSVLTKGQFIRFYEQDKTPCCIEPDFKVALFQGGETEGWIPLTVAIDDENPMMVVGGQKGLYFALK